MNELPIARIRIEGLDLVVVFDASFDSMTEAERHTALAAFRTQTSAAMNLAVVWQDPSGKTKFFAAPHLHAFLQAVEYGQLIAQSSQAKKY